MTSLPQVNIPKICDAMVPVLTRVEHVIEELTDVFSWRLDLSPFGGQFSFQPGQFNMLYLPGVGEVPISISGDAHDSQTLIHTIRRVGTVTKQMANVAPGSWVGVRGPFGSAWPTDRFEGRDVVIVAGGLGLAPLRGAILHAIRNRAKCSSLSIAYGARTPVDILYRADLEKWRGRFDVKVEVTVDRADTDWLGNVGVVTSLFTPLQIKPNSLVLLCGPEVMMRFAARALLQRGVLAEDIYVSLERNMQCGIGLCGHCQLGPTLMCQSGPVYPFNQVENWMSVREL